MPIYDRVLTPKLAEVMESIDGTFFNFNLCSV